MAEIKKVGIWLRVSTTMQAEETDSLEHHEKRALAYCQAKDWKVVETYSLEGVSGKAILNHPTTLRMLADIRAGKINTLVFSSLSRLARNTRELLKISEIFQENNASLVSLKESIDTDSPAGRLFFTVISALATFEAEEISERVKASVPIRAKLGKATGGAAPFGYRWENDQLVVEPREAAIRKEMFDIFLDTQRKKTTARILNEKGYRTRAGKKFSDSTVTRLLTDTIAKGLRRANYTESTGDKKHWVLKPESEWVYSQVEPIVTEEVFDKVNAILKAQYKSRKKVSRIPVHPFSGLVYCCCDENAKMRVFSSIPQKYTCPKCRSKIPKSDLENIFREEIKGFILSPQKMSEHLSKADKTINDKEKQLKILKNDLATALAESKKLYDLFLSDQITADGFGRVHKPIDERIGQLENSIPELESEIDLLKTQILNESQLAYDSQSLYERWQSFSDEEKNKVVASLTDRITVCRNEVEISFHFIPSVINGGNKAMNRQGFMAATSWKRAGKRALRLAREMLM